MIPLRRVLETRQRALSEVANIQLADCMVVLDDFLDRDVFLSIQASIGAASFPWERCMVLKDSAAYLDPAYNIQDIHGFFLKNARHQYRSAKLDILKPLIQKLNPIDLIKVKANRTTKKDHHIEYGMHVDTQRVGATTAVFYLNSNNGYTLFDGGEKVGSVANRLVLFDSNKLHTGASCTDADYRLVLNMNMFLAKDSTLE